TCTESFSCEKINFTRRGNAALRLLICVPVHSAGISGHASLSFFPANGPEAKRHWSPVSQASPSGSARLVFSGKSGASVRAPQGRGLKIGSSRAGHSGARLELTRRYQKNEGGGAS